MLLLQVLNEELELIFFISHECQQKMEAIEYLSINRNKGGNARISEHP